MRRWFSINYDRHGKKDWLITTRTSTGKLVQRLTRHVIVKDVMLHGNINLRQTPPATLQGFGQIKYGRTSTLIRP